MTTATTTGGGGHPRVVDRAASQRKAEVPQPAEARVQAPAPAPDRGCREIAFVEAGCLGRTVQGGGRDRDRCPRRRGGVEPEREEARSREGGGPGEGEQGIGHVDIPQGCALR